MHHNFFGGHCFAGEEEAFDYLVHSLSTYVLFHNVRRELLHSLLHVLKRRQPRREPHSPQDNTPTPPETEEEHHVRL